MKIKTLSLFPMLLCCIISTPSIAGKLLFSENFESWNSNKWWWVQACGISSNQKHSGNYSLLCEHSPNAENSGLVANVIELPTTVADSYTEFTIKYWWYTGSNWYTGKGVKFLRLRRSGVAGCGYPIQQEFYWNDGSEPMEVSARPYGEETCMGQTYDGYTDSDWIFKQDLKRGRWMEIIVHYILNTPGVANGTLDIYFDGVQKYHNTSYVFRKSQNIAYNQFFIPSNSITRTANMFNYIDDIEIWGGMPSSNDYLQPAPPARLSIQ